MPISEHILAGTGTHSQESAFQSRNCTRGTRSAQPGSVLPALELLPGAEPGSPRRTASPGTPGGMAASGRGRQPLSGAAAAKGGRKTMGRGKEAAKWNHGGTHPGAGTPGGEREIRSPLWGRGPDGPVETLLILMKMKPGGSFSSGGKRTHLSPHGSKKFINALDAFCPTRSNFFMQPSVTWKCKPKTMKSSERDRAVLRALGMSWDGHSRTQKPDVPGGTSEGGRSGAQAEAAARPDAVVAQPPLRRGRRAPSGERCRKLRRFPARGKTTSRGVILTAFTERGPRSKIWGHFSRLALGGCPSSPPPPQPPENALLAAAAGGPVHRSLSWQCPYISGSP